MKMAWFKTFAQKLVIWATKDTETTYTVHIYILFIRKCIKCIPIWEGQVINN